MSFSNKKILLIGVIVVVLIIATGVAIVFNWQKTHIPLDISQEAIKAKCLEDVGKMDDDELINEIYNLKDPEEIDLVTGEDRISAAHKGIINYLICKVEKTKDENDYNQVKNLISKLAIQEENKKNELNRLDEVYLDRDLSFTNTLAVGELTKVCPDELAELCLNRKRTSNAPMYEDWCLNICNDIIEEYPVNSEKFDGEILNFNDWNSDSNYRFGQYTWRSAMAFRFGGKDLALKICDNLIDNDKDKDKCYEEVEKFESLKTKDSSKCDIFRESLEKTICEM